MNKQKKQFLALVIILVVCVIAYAAVYAYNKNQKESEEESDADLTVYAVDVSDISAFSYMADGKKLSFTKEGEEWIYDGDDSLDLDEDSVESMLSNLAEVKASEKISPEESGEPAEYGLDTPQNTVTVSADTETTTIDIGDSNEMLSGYYLKKSGDDAVYLADDTLAEAFSGTVESLVKEESGTESVQPQEDSEVR